MEHIKQDQIINIPNALTVVRILLLPVVVWRFIIGDATGALIAYLAAMLTDALAGIIARKFNQITARGKLLDPLADKLLVCSAMICLVEMGRIPAWIVIVIISREFIISGFRLIASDNGRVIAASYWGKFKTTFQMVMICLMIANIEALSVLTTIVMWVALVLTVVSLVDYLMKNKDVLKDQH